MVTQEQTRAAFAPRTPAGNGMEPKTVSNLADLEQVAQAQPRNPMARAMAASREAVKSAWMNFTVRVLDAHPGYAYTDLAQNWPDHPAFRTPVDDRGNLLPGAKPGLDWEFYEFLTQKYGEDRIVQAEWLERNQFFGTPLNGRVDDKGVRVPESYIGAIFVRPDRRQMSN